MANDFNRPEGIKYSLHKAQTELLEVLLQPDDAPYPWDPTAPEAEAYFGRREQEFVLEDWPQAEVAARSQSFFTRITHLWSTPVQLAESTEVNTLPVVLAQRFAARVPQGWLDTISRQAYQVFLTQQSTAAALVQCVQGLLPDWAEEDLLVLARPFAYAMRGKETEAIESVLVNVQDRDWSVLSEIEQARLSLAIARYALAKINN